VIHFRFSQGFAGLAAKLPYSECRYAIYEHEWKTHDGRQVSKIWFISWFPNNSTPYDKMAYTTAKKYLREFLDGVYDVQSSTTDELEIAMFGPKEEEEESDEDF
jgi:cofilin